MSFLDKNTIPRRNWIDAKARGYSFVSDIEVLLDGWYIIALRSHLSKEVGDESWYSILNIDKTDNAGTVKCNANFVWPSAPWSDDPITRRDTKTATFFLIKFKTPEDLSTFRLTYL